MKRYYIADVAGYYVVLDRRPERPAAIPFRTIEHANAVAERMNEGKTMPLGVETSTDGEVTE